MKKEEDKTHKPEGVNKNGIEIGREKNKRMDNSGVVEAWIKYQVTAKDMEDDVKEEEKEEEGMGEEEEGL